MGGRAPDRALSDDMHLINFDAAAFLRDTWQRRPLLIRGAWDAWANPLEPDELAGLACEDGVEARIVTTKRKGYELEQGPFAEKRFAKAGKKPWTLLVQAVDTYDPDVAALREAFRFIPDWRIDDVMVSYASDGGGVGPHYDQYDVFLVQGLGRRRWQIGGRCDTRTPLQPHDDLRLLADFVPTEEWVLEPGDMLYIPPGIAHHGVAVGDDCMTYSVGFRAPSHAELIGHWADDLIAGLSDDDRYADPGLKPQSNPGEIDAAALAKLYAMVTEAVGDATGFARWFGSYVTEPKHDAGPGGRFAFVRHAGGAWLFADGTRFDCSAAFAEAMCDGRVAPADEAERAIVAQLIEQGSLSA